MPDLHELAAAFIACMEGSRLTAYRDSGGVLTIGIGHTGKDITPGLTISASTQAALFYADQEPLIQLVQSLNRPLLESTMLVDFGFNCGIGRLRQVLSGSDSLDNPAHTKDAHGNVLSGLVNRRNLENLLIAISRGI